MYVYVKRKLFKKIHIHRKNNFVEIFKNLARYKFENNFVWIIKIIMWNT